MPVNKRIGYYKSWEAHSYPPSNINVTDVYTHVIYAFLGLNSDGNLRFLNHNDSTILKDLAKLKTKNANLKLLFSVGGETASTTFSTVAADETKRNTMAKCTLSYLKKYSIDGVDIDWEFPGQNDKKNFILLLQSLRKNLDCNGQYLLTVAVSPLANDVNIGYDVPAISKIVDFIHVMTYNFHQASEGRTGENSPLYASSADSPWQRQNCNCSVSLNNWIAAGAPKAKLVLGLAFYGQLFNLINSSECSIGAPTTTVGGTLPYKEIAKLKWTAHFDEEQQVPFKYSGKQWIGYDDPRAIATKMRYVADNGFGGVMTWAINDDNGDLALAITINKSLHKCITNC